VVLVEGETVCVEDGLAVVVEVAVGEFVEVTDELAVLLPEGEEVVDVDGDAEGVTIPLGELLSEDEEEGVALVPHCYGESRANGHSCAVPPEAEASQAVKAPPPPTGNCTCSKSRENDRQITTSKE
jgi:hypothetical protein